MDAPYKEEGDEEDDGDGRGIEIAVSMVE